MNDCYKLYTGSLCGRVQDKKGFIFVCLHDLYVKVTFLESPAEEEHPLPP